MYNKLEKIRATEVKLRDIELTINELPENSYYKIFGTESEKQRDLNELLQTKSNVLNKRILLLKELESSIKSEIKKVEQIQNQLLNK